MALRFQQKLVIPTNSRALVERTQVTALLDQAIQNKRVVALAAPAGWGKTTALVQWARQSPMQIAWYTLDSSDLDPRLFLDYLLHAVEPYVPQATELMTRLEATSRDELAGLFQTVAHCIAEVETPFALVFDDFHIIKDDSSTTLPGTALILSLITSLTEYAPSCHLVFASRTIPALHGMVRLLVQQRAAVFDYTSLQFTSLDIQQLAGLTRNMMLGDEQALMLAQRFDGWIAGLTLYLDQLPADARFRSVDDLADTAPIYAFFAEQVIAPLPFEIQRFLEDTSVIEDLSPQRCNVLRDASDSAWLLEEVKRYGLSISSRAEWLAYHSLFREFLRSRLARDPIRYRHMLRRAGDLYRSEDDPERAIDCYLAADAESEAIAMLHAVVPHFRRLSRHTTLLACFDRLSNYRMLQQSRGTSRISLSTPQVNMLPAALLLDQSRIYLDLALWERAYLAVQLAETIGLPAEQNEARILYAELSCLQGNAEQAEAALSQIDLTRMQPDARLDYYYTNGRMLILRGELELAIQSLEQAHTFATMQSEMANDPLTMARTYDLLGWAYGVQGARLAALRYLQRADACWQLSGNAGRRAATLNNLGMIAVEEGRYEQAHHAFETGLELAQQTGRGREESGLRCSIADLNLLEGHMDAAQEGFATAYTLAMRLDLAISAAEAAAGALWTAVLRNDRAVGTLWLETIAPLREYANDATWGRIAVSEARLLSADLLANQQRVQHLRRELHVRIELLGKIEYAALLLLDAVLAEPPVQAHVLWEHFAQQVVGWPLALQVALVTPYRALVNAETDALAQQLQQHIAPEPDVRWTIRALGAFVCQHQDSSCDLSPLHRALLLRLLEAGAAGVAVERLWEDVWGNEHVSMPAVHMALSRLRNQTGLDLRIRDGNAAIHMPFSAIDYDVLMLKRLLEQPLNHENVIRVQSLYRGDFFPSAPLSASLWVESIRTFIQHRYLNALEQYADLQAASTPEEALRLYQHILQVDGCRESTAAKLMRLAARFGHRTLVSATFEQLKGSLRALGATPQPTTSALYQELR